MVARTALGPGRMLSNGRHIQTAPLVYWICCEIIQFIKGQFHVIVQGLCN